MLAQLGVLLLDGDVAGQGVGVPVSLLFAGVAGRPWQPLDELVHADDGLGRDLGQVGVVDAAGDIAVGVRLLRREKAVEQRERVNQ